MPLRGRSGGSNRSSHGGCAVWFGGNIYALKGKRTREFWKYLPGSDTWVELESLTGMGVYSGGAIALGDTTSEGGWYLYALKAGGSEELWRFTLSTVVAKEKKRNRPTGTTCQGMLVLTGRQSAVLLDIMGRKVMSLKPGENDIRHVAPGVYFVRTEGRTRPQRVVVTR
jgi:hypothetical protein